MIITEQQIESCRVIVRDEGRCNKVTSCATCIFKTDPGELCEDEFVFTTGGDVYKPCPEKLRLASFLLVLFGRDA